MPWHTVRLIELRATPLQDTRSSGSNRSEQVYAIITEVRDEHRLIAWMVSPREPHERRERFTQLMKAIAQYSGRGPRTFGLDSAPRSVGGRLDLVGRQLKMSVLLAAMASSGLVYGIFTPSGQLLLVITSLICLYGTWHVVRMGRPKVRSTASTPMVANPSSPVVVEPPQQAPVRSPVPEGRAWALNRLAYRLFSTRWFWLVFGLFVGGVGMPFLFASPLHFHPIVGTVARYSYADRTLLLIGDRTSYSFLPDNFPSTLPASIPSGTSVRIWIDRSYRDIDALQLIGQDGTPGPTYMDIFFADPVRQERETFLAGFAFTTIGAVTVLGSLCWPLFTRSSRRDRRQHWPSNEPS
jgi:hypothetical protein